MSRAAENGPEVRVVEEGLQDREQRLSRPPGSAGRLAFVSHRFEANDGQGRVSFEIVKEALAQGFHVTLVATHCAAELRSHPQVQLVEVGRDRVPTTLLRNLYFAFDSARWLRRHRGSFDLIQTNGFVTWERADVVVAHFVHTAWRHNAQYPFRSWSPYHLYHRLFSRLNSRWERQTFARAQRIVAVSPLIASELRFAGVPDERIVIIPNGVDTAQFHPGEGDRASFQLPNEGSVALFIGDIKTARKNLETVLRAVQGVQGCTLAVAGAAEGSPYPAMAQQLGIGDRVIFLGKIKQIPELMRCADLFVFPSRYDPFGLVVLEAMASGVPVITAATAGASEYIGGGGVLLRDPNDVPELRDAMADLLAFPEKRETMGQAGRGRATELQWTSMAGAYVALYERLLQAR